MDLSEWLSNGLNISAQGVLQLLFAARCMGKLPKIWHFPAYIMLLYAALWAADMLRFPEMGAELLLLYGACQFMPGAKRPVSFAVAVLALYGSGFSFGVVNSLELLLLMIAPFPASALWVLAILGELCALSLCAFSYRYISEQFSAEDVCAPWAGLLLMPGLFFLVMQSWIMGTAYADMPAFPVRAQADKQLILLTVQLLGFAALFCALYAYQRTCEGFRAQTALISLRQESHAQRRYVEEARVRYERTRAFRHDIRNHLSVLGGLLRKGDVRQAEAYLQKLNPAAGELSFPVNTGNPVLDILLGEKLSLAGAKGIRTEISLAFPAHWVVEDTDLCVIFANALDNAIQACSGLESSAFIRIEGERQGDFCLLEFENTCLSEAGALPRMGTGLSNIKAASEKYGGTMVIEQTDSSFCLQVLLDISIHQDDSP